MDDHPCTDCRRTVAGRVGAVRLIGPEPSGRVVKLCSRCYLKRGEDVLPVQRTPSPAVRRRR